MTTKQRRQRLTQILDGLIALAGNPHLSEVERSKAIKSANILTGMLNMQSDLVAGTTQDNMTVLADLIGNPQPNIEIDDVILAQTSPAAQN